MAQVRACSAAKMSISSSVQSISSNRMAQRACSYIWLIRTASYCRKEQTLLVSDLQGTDSNQLQLTALFSTGLNHSGCFLPPPTSAHSWTSQAQFPFFCHGSLSGPFFWKIQHSSTLSAFRNLFGLSLLTVAEAASTPHPLRKNEWVGLVLLSLPNSVASF